MLQKGLYQWTQLWIKIAELVMDTSMFLKLSCASPSQSYTRETRALPCVNRSGCVRRTTSSKEIQVSSLM